MSRRLGLFAIALATATLIAWLLWSLRAARTPSRPEPAPAVTATTPLPSARPPSARAVSPVARPAPPPPGTPLPRGEAGPHTSMGMPPAPPEPIDPVLRARQKLIRVRMKYRWLLAERILGRPIPEEQRARLEAEFAEIATRADRVVDAHAAATIKDDDALMQMTRLNEDYRRAVMRELHMTAEQYAALPELPGGPLPPRLLP